MCIFQSQTLYVLLAITELVLVCRKRIMSLPLGSWLKINLDLGLLTKLPSVLDCYNTFLDLDLQNPHDPVSLCQFEYPKSFCVWCLLVTCPLRMAMNLPNLFNAIKTSTPNLLEGWGTKVGIMEDPKQFSKVKRWPYS
jgi:hypothetical protein